MERHFEKDLNELKERMLWMGSLAERAVHQSVHAVLESDEQLAKRVLDEEDAINELQLEVDDRVVDPGDRLFRAMVLDRAAVFQSRHRPIPR